MENQQSINRQLAILRLKNEMLTSEARQMITEIHQQRDVEICNVRNEATTKRMTLKNKRFEIDARQHDFFLKGEQHKSDKLKLQRIEIDKQLSLIQDQLNLEIGAIKRKHLDRESNILEMQRKQANEYKKENAMLIEKLVELQQNKQEVEQQ